MKHLTLINFIIGVEETADAPQGDNSEAIRKAQEALDRVVSQLAECERKLETQKQAKEANDSAIAQLKLAEQNLQQAEKELAVAVSELQKVFIKNI